MAEFSLNKTQKWTKIKPNHSHSFSKKTGTNKRTGMDDR